MKRFLDSFQTHSPLSFLDSPPSASFQGGGLKTRTSPEIFNGNSYQWISPRGVPRSVKIVR